MDVNIARVRDDRQASSNNVLGRCDSWSGVTELSKELGGNGTPRARPVKRCSAF
jgi:hypothetical protein